MANDCFNGVSLTGPQPIIDILLYKIKTISDKANLINERFLFPYVDQKEHDDMLYANDFCDNGDNSFNFVTPWRSDPVSIFIMCYAMGLQFEMYSCESSSQLEEEYRLTQSGVPEFRELSPEEYEACTYPEGYIEDPDDDDANSNAEDDSADRRDNLLSAKEWKPYDMDLSLLKRKVYEPSTQH